MTARTAGMTARATRGTTRVRNYRDLVSNWLFAAGIVRLYGTHSRGLVENQVSSGLQIEL